MAAQDRFRRAACGLPQAVAYVLEGAVSLLGRENSGVLYDTVTIIGAGLIGGSMGLAIKACGAAREIIGVGRRQVSLDAALKVGAVDRASLCMEEAVRVADLVVIATPVGAVSQIMPSVASALRPGATLTEVSSVKQAVIDMIRSQLPPGVPFVPTHPMAGSEQRGPAAASAALFRGSVCIFSPVGKDTNPAEERLRQLWEGFGARVITMPPDRHDQAVAAVSHVPHLVASVLVGMLDQTQLACAGTGFVDFTRIASSDPDLWTDICAHNRPAIARALARLIDHLDRVRAAVDAGDDGAIRALLAAGKSRRDALLAERRAAKGR